MRIGVITLTIALSMAFAFFVVAGFPVTSGAGGQDQDGDGVGDAIDNCLLVQNGPSQPCNQVDDDSDGYGNTCDADYNNTTFVTLADFALLLPRLNTAVPPTEPEFDHNCTATITLADFSSFLSLSNAPVGASGLACANVVPCTVP